VCQGGNPVQRIENITLGILSEVLIRAIPKGLKVNFILSASICRMATAFFSFWAALIKIYSYFRLYTFMSIYVKNPADLVYVLSVTICKTIFDPQRG
ncbi:MULTISPECIES: hypothetical protein, partial [Bacteroides]|uniref:hypothetical protein n=2 Tax=Bacteroidia TaxID=200643 RepID=UPI00257A0A56